ncbi:MULTISPECIES: hypothetical protein [unclassified Thiocapsa]|uniref:hypothetical protein n=1 Tax=unclassified Thiocapsa TaxID=2641286 RepID=UPI0035B4273D
MQIRDLIDGLKADREAIARAWPAHAEAAAAIAEEVERLAARGRQILNPAYLRRGKLPDLHFAASARDFLALMAVADPQRVAARLVDLATEDHPAPGITAPDRARRLAEIADQLRALELDEERLIRSSPTPITRRADASPEVVLTPDLDRLAA